MDGVRDSRAGAAGLRSRSGIMLYIAPGEASFEGPLEGRRGR